MRRDVSTLPPMQVEGQPEFMPMLRVEMLLKSWLAVFSVRHVSKELH